MRLFDLIKLFAFDEACRVYTSENEKQAQFEGFVSDIPYWLCECEIMENGGIGVERSLEGAEDGVIYFYVEV